MKKYLFLALIMMSSTFSIGQTCVTVCNSFINFSLDQNGEGFITPDMIDEGSWGDCDLQVELLSNGVSIMGPADTLFIDCSFQGTFDLSLVDAISGSACWGQILIEDVQGFCNDDVGPGNLPLAITGQNTSWITTDIDLNGNLLESVHQFLYAIPEANILSGENVINFPATPGNVGLGIISTLDLVEIMKIFEFGTNNPMRAIMADIDDSGYLGINDLVILREFILAIIANIPAENTLYVNENYVFDPNFDPFDFDVNFREFTFNSDTLSNVSFNFDAYSYGDISSIDSISSNTETEVRSGSEKMIIDEQSMEQGQIYSININLESDIDLIAAQTGIHLKDLKVVEIEHNYSSIEFMHTLVDGELKVSYVPTTINEQLSFTLIVEAEQNGVTSDFISLSDEFEQQVVNYENHNDINLVFQSPSFTKEELLEQFHLAPNPTYDVLFITLPESQNVQMDILSADGLLIKRMTPNTNSVMISKEDLPTSGMYFIQLDVDGNRITKKFVIL